MHLDAIEMSNLSGIRIHLSGDPIGFLATEVAVGFKLQHALMEDFGVPFADQNYVAHWEAHIRDFWR